MTRRIVFVVCLLAAGCGSGVSDLPLAPEPTAFEGGPWAVEFRLELDPGFWETGAHRYQLWLECEPIGPRQWSQHNFEADGDAELIGQDVYLRFRGLSLYESGPTGIKVISPEQPTVALVTVINLEQEQAQRAAAECMAELRLEDGSVHLLPPGEPFRV